MWKARGMHGNNNNNNKTNEIAAAAQSARNSNKNYPKQNSNKCRETIKTTIVLCMGHPLHFRIYRGHASSTAFYIFSAVLFFRVFNFAISLSCLVMFHNWFTVNCTQIHIHNMKLVYGGVCVCVVWFDVQSRRKLLRPLNWHCDD